MPRGRPSSHLKRPADDSGSPGAVTKRNRKVEDQVSTTEVPKGSLSDPDENNQVVEVDEIDSDSDIGEFIRRKEREETFYVDEEGSFFFASDNPVGESCIRFVAELPSEKAKREAQELREDDTRGSNFGPVNSESGEPDAEKPVVKRRGRPPKSKSVNTGRVLRSSAKGDAKTKPAPKPKPDLSKTTVKRQPVGRKVAAQAPTSVATSAKITLKIPPKPVKPAKAPFTESKAKHQSNVKFTAHDESYGEEEKMVEDADDEPDFSDPEVYQAAVEQALDSQMIELAVEIDGGHEHIQLPFNAHYDTFTIKVAKLFHTAPDDLQLTYKLPGMKKTELGRHLRSNENYLKMMLDARKAIVTKVVKANGKKVKGNQASIDSQIATEVEGYKLEIFDRVLSKVGLGKGGVGPGGKPTTTATPDAKSDKYARDQRYIEGRKCKTCHQNCAILCSEDGHVEHIPLPDPCVGLWTSLCGNNKTTPYGPPPHLQLEQNSQRPLGGMGGFGPPFL